MTAQDLAQRYKTEESDVNRCAVLAGVGMLGEYDKEQEVLISFAIMLNKFGIREDRIRICCTSPSRFPEMVLQEQAECTSKTRRETLNGMLDCVDEDWSGTLYEIDDAVMLLEYQLETSDGVAFGPYPWMSMLMIAGISLAVALLLKPHIQALFERVLSEFLK